MIIYIENTEDILRKLLWFINEFSIFSRYKIDIQKYVALLHNNSKVKVREINEIIPFTMTLKKKKKLGVNIPKETEDIHRRQKTIRH